MTVVCLEGPSAAGKTTLAAAIASIAEGVVIPEVNQLFIRPESPPWTWYFDRQVERWIKANVAAKAGDLAILDGDIFQPLWYGWTYGYTEGASLKEMLEFYIPLFDNGTLTLPHRYCVLECAESELRRRRAADATRTRRNFERHLALVRAQRDYFDALSRLVPELIRWLPMSDVESSVRAVLAELADRPRPKRPTSSGVLLDLGRMLAKRHES